MSELLQDVLSYGMKVVFCGLNPGSRSVGIGCYYADPRNRFWKVLYDVGLTPKELMPCEFRELLNYGIGLTDLIKKSCRKDEKPRREDIEELKEKILKFKPKILSFNGKKPAKYFFSTKEIRFGELNGKIDGTVVFVLPSTSGENTGWNKHNCVMHWQKLNDCVNQV